MPLRHALWSGRTAVGVVSVALILTAAALASTTPSETVAREGGTFRVAITLPYSTIDPAINPQYLLRPACAALLNTPPKRPPAGLRFEPELAADYPTVSKDGKMYTFTVRRGARFSTGAPVLARDVVHSLERVLALGPRSDFLASRLIDIVGAKAMYDGKATRLTGAVARGRTLILRLRHRVSDFYARVSVCVVPASLPVDPEGVKAPIPSPAPYYIADYIPDKRVVLERNRFYGGGRPQHVAQYLVEMGFDAETVVDRVKSGDIELAGLGGAAWAPFVGDLTERYGINKSQFFSVPGTFLRMFTLNASRPLFRNNARLRRAVNFAVDRRALIREFGPASGTPTDQYLPPILPGYRNETIYPIEQPDLKAARRLATGRTRSGKAVLYTCTSPTCVAQSYVLERNLDAIGLGLETVQFPAPVLFEKLATDRAGFDIGWIGWGMSGPEKIGEMFNGRAIDQPGSANWSYFDSPAYNRLIDAAAALPLGRARERSYGELDVRLSRDAAPGIPYGVTNDFTLVSANVGCIVLNPTLDTTAVCLK